jgi:glucose-6-phosphate isomerase
MSWSTYAASLIRYPPFGFSLDTSLMDLDESFFATMAPKVAKAHADIAALEAGAIANPDEGRMVGHYWLRNAALAPTPELRDAIVKPLAE